MAKSIFDQFTHKYSLCKTLRFELKPVGKTKELLEQNNVFKKDQTIDDSYNQAKLYFDKLHQEFINEALAPDKVDHIDFVAFANFLDTKATELRRLRREINEARQASTDTDTLQEEVRRIEELIDSERKKLFKQIVEELDKEAEAWKKHYLKIGILSEKDLKKENTKGVGFLTSAAVLNILKHRFPLEKDTEFQKAGLPSLFVEERENPGNKRYIFDSFDNFSGYLTRFQETRKNIYDNTGKVTALATRIVSNFELFLANKKTFEDKYRKCHEEIGFDRTGIFDPANYKHYLRQSSIETADGKEGSEETYNKIIGRINQRIKEYRDTKASEAKQEGKKINKTDYPLFKTLEKQILGDLSKQRALIEARHDATEEEVFVERFQEFITLNQTRFEEAKNFMRRFFEEEFANEYEGIFIKSSTINTISRRWFADFYQFESQLPQAAKNKDERDTIKVKKFVTLTDIKRAIESLGEAPFKEAYYTEKIIRLEQPNWQGFLAVWRHEFESLFLDELREGATTVKGYNSCHKEAKTLTSFSKIRNKNEIAKVKNYADATLRIYQLMKYLALDERDLADQQGISTNFYAELDTYSKDLDFIRYYNSFRNFVTKKTYQEDKIKLNFEKGNLLGGWAESPEGNAQFYGYILRKDSKYYLGISTNSTILDAKKHKDIAPKEGDEYYEKMLYRQLKSTSIYGSAYLGKYGSKYADDKLKLTDQELIARVKNLLSDKYTHIYPELQEVVNTNYDSANELAKAISALSLYSLEFKPVSTEYIDAGVYESSNRTNYLYMFEITNKDFLEGAKGRPNIHTLYFKHLFSEANLKKPIIKLSGGAEVFYRSKSENIEKHKDKQGKEVVAHKRYAEEKLLFHLPIVINMDDGRPSKFNSEINAFLANNPNINIIGLDRGEKHLVYYSIINQQGEILNQGSLNTINGQNYYQKLVEREKERRENRQSWNPVTKIKDLKHGYVSQVVRKIVDLAIEYNAIIVMEDLNMRFKQVRGGIERSVYQQLEKQLIDKLNYLTFKDREPTEPGGILNGYQLAAPFETFEKMSKQTGIIFYTQAEYTSITDPLTGFRKNIYINNSVPQTKIKNALEKFDAIGWDEEEQSYFFTYNPINFTDKKSKNNTLDKTYTVYSKVPRIRREKDKNGYWQHSLIDLNQKFRELFELWDFERPDAEDLREEMLRKETDSELAGKRMFDGKERSFYHAFIYLFNLILNLRNSFSEQWKIEKDENGNIKAENINADNVDFIVSPVKPFFSTYAEHKGQVISPRNFADFDAKIKARDADRIRQEFNGDANGAYNIARKGVIILENISKKPNKPDLYVSKNDWDKHTQDKWNPTSPSVR